MTYNEAIEFKKKLGRDQLEENNTTLRVFVTPMDYYDLSRYLKDYRSGGFSDKTSLLYSSNGLFTVQGLWTDGADIIYKDLTK